MSQTVVALPDDASRPWAPPGAGEEFVFTTIGEAPAWIDRGWASFDNGAPALAVPAGDHPFGQPYTTVMAHPGDTVRWVVASGARAAHAEVFAAVVSRDAEGSMTKRVAQESNASLEDALKGGAMSEADLSEEAKGQVRARATR